LKILASRHFPGPAWDELGDVEYLDAPLPDGAGGRREDVEGLAVVGERIDDETLDLFSNLKVVANYGVGYDTVDVEACAARGVVVTNTPGVLTAATAELAFALLLAVRRRIVAGDRAVREGRWRGGWADPDFIGRDVNGSTLGIVGFGRIGRAVAHLAAAFGMRVLHHSRRRDGEEWRDLDHLLAEADAVSLHVPLTPETRGMLDAERLALLRDGASLINTARGQIVDEDALVRQLVAGRIEAGLDVFAYEPEVPRDLLGLPNVVLTPHVGSATAETRAAMTRVLVENLLAVERGQRPPNPV
jgi:glyoxylate reductase